MDVRMMKARRRVTIGGLIRRSGLLATCLLPLAAGIASAKEVVAAQEQQASAEAADRAQGKAKPDKNGKICKREDVTGSRFPKRVCYTPEQWEARQRAAREAVREIDARPVGKIGEG